MSEPRPEGSVAPTRRKARSLAATGVILGFGATSFGLIAGNSWPFQLFNVAVFGLTCAIAGVTWWTTRQSDAEDRVDARLRVLERLKSGR